MNSSEPSPLKAQTPLDQLTYEQAFAELESIVSRLESEEHPLEEAMKLFERGRSLARHCTGLLDKASLRVQQISTDGLVDFTNE
jgi:exodeoxyribonuclease VII small subunit